MLRFKVFLAFLIISISLNSDCIFSQQKENSNHKTTISVSNTIQQSQSLTREKLRNKKVVSLAIVLVVILFFLFYFFYQNNKLKERLRLKLLKQKILLNVINSGIESHENDRKNIAAFLHDNINSLLSSAGLHLNTFTAQNNIDSEEIRKTKIILQEIHDLLRDMSHDLIPSLLVRFGLIYAIEDLCERNSNSVIQFDFSSNISTEKRYTEKFEMQIYFMVSELFNNIIKHSEAQNAQIRLKENYKHFKIIITDNGKGFKTKKINGNEGFGINQIRARIKKFKGSFEISSKANEGTKIKIKIPLPH